MLTCANLLTLLRLVLAPAFIVLFLTNRPWAALCTLALAMLFEISDLLDGYMARRLGQVSSLGKLIDPLADSICRFSIFLAFTTEEGVRGHPWPLLIVALIFYRDAIVAYVRTFAATGGTVLAARFSGKLKAAVQGTGILVFLTLRAASFFWAPLEAYRPIALYCVMLPILLVTLGSGLDYVCSNWRAIVAMSSHTQEQKEQEKCKR